MALCTGAIHFYVASYALSKMDFSITTIDVVYFRSFLSLSVPLPLLLVYCTIVIVRLEIFTFYFHWRIRNKQNFVSESSNYIDNSPYPEPTCLYPMNMVFSLRYKNTQQGLRSDVVIIALYVP